MDVESLDSVAFSDAQRPEGWYVDPFDEKMARLRWWPEVGPRSRLGPGDRRPGAPVKGLRSWISRKGKRADIGRRRSAIA